MARNMYDAPVKKGRGVAMLGVVGVAAVVLIGGVLAALGQQRTAADPRCCFHLVSHLAPSP